MRRLVGFLLAVAFCLGGAAQHVVRLAISMEPKSIDPNIAYGTEFSRVLNNLFVPLVDYDYFARAPVPCIAEKWEISADGLQYTFYLRKDAKWSDGTPLTAHDVVYTVRRIVNPQVGSPYGTWFDMLEGYGEPDLTALGVVALDDYTVQFKLKYPASFFLALLSGILRPVPSWVVEKYGDRWTRPENIVVSGPYLLQSWEPYNKIVLVKNPLYFDANNVKIDQVIFYYVPEAATAFSMYLTGDLDELRVSGEYVQRAQADPTLAAQLHAISALYCQYVGFNCSVPPFDNPLVRKAFAAATDRSKVIAALGGGADPAYTFIPPGISGYIPPEAGVGIKYDPELAKSFLAQAGYPEGKGFPTVKFGFGADERSARIAQALQALWQDTLGIKIELMPREHATYFETVVAGAYNVFLLGWGADYPDGYDFLCYTFHSVRGEQTVKWYNPRYDALIDEAARTIDPGMREKMYQEAQKILVEEDAVIIPLFYRSSFILTKPHIERPYTPVSAWDARVWEWSIKE
jgi:oligopeptide transport system substrate-binding protein